MTCFKLRHVIKNSGLTVSRYRHMNIMPQVAVSSVSDQSESPEKNNNLVLCTISRMKSATEEFLLVLITIYIHFA